MGFNVQEAEMLLIRIHKCANEDDGSFYRADLSIHGARLGWLDRRFQTERAARQYYSEIQKVIEIKPQEAV